MTFDEGEDSPAAKLAKLQHMLSHYRFPQADTVPLLAALLSLPHPAGSPPITVSPQKQKEKTQAALVAWLVEEAEQKTVYNTWEDVHWADPSTLEVLNLVIDQAPTVSLCVLLTFRPEFMPPWGNRSHLSQMTLSRLGRSQVEAMVERVTGGKALPSEVVQQIVAKTDGVPLFVEELTKTVVESIESIESIGSIGSVGSHDPRSLPAIAIPATLHDSLMARLDRLGRVKEVAQLGATLGREFSYELLAAVSPLGEETLQHGLKQLVEAELVYQRGLVPQAHYLFKHALIQDTAYQSLLKSTRQQYHRQIAQVLAERFPETVETQPELLFRLIEFYLNRGELQTLRELAEQLMRLAQSVQDPYPLSVAHLALGATLTWLGELSSARLHVEQAIALYDPQQLPRPTSTTADPRMEGLTPERAPWLSYRWASNAADPRIECLAYAAWTLWPLGYPDQALKRSHEVLALAEGLSQPFGLAYALGVAAGCHLSRREGPLARERAEAMMTLATEQGFPYWLGWATLLRGGALAAQGRAEGGIPQIQQGIAAYRATRAEALLPYFLALLAEAYGKAGQAEEGLTVLAEALAQVEKTGERYYEAELYRLKGELTLAQSSVQSLESRVQTNQKAKGKGQKAKIDTDPRPLTPDPQAETEAEACFHKAIDIARRQQAKSLELRTVVSLSRLWQSQGKKEEARQMLAETYSWFTEGFDTKDLQEAKALLDSLGSSI